jgi:hypothetical protein
LPHFGLRADPEADASRGRLAKHIKKQKGKGRREKQGINRKEEEMMKKESVKMRSRRCSKIRTSTELLSNGG